MKVYLVWYNTMDGHQLHGVFDSLENAKNGCVLLALSRFEHWIEEEELNNTDTCRMNKSWSFSYDPKTPSWTEDGT